MKYLTTMPNPSRFSGTSSWKQRLDGQIATNFVYSMIFTYLILFSIFNSVYIDLPSAPDQPRDYDIENVAVNPISCSFFISGYYERTPRYICYLSLVLTVVIRNHKWLAAGAPTLILSYSGVAAIHLIILFATNNRLDLQKAKSYCETLPTLGAGTPFVACAGVYDPDVGLSMAIVSIVMFGALPIVAWSRTFRKSKNKVILIFWLLLIAVGHTFYPLIESNPGSNFQICPKDYIEPLPTGFQAPFFRSVLARLLLLARLDGATILPNPWKRLFARLYLFLLCYNRLLWPQNPGYHCVGRFFRSKSHVKEPCH